MASDLLELPFVVKHLIGYDSAADTMLLRGTDGRVYGSPDGERVVLAVPQPDPLPTHLPAKAVPGMARPEVASVQWGTKYSG